MGQGLLNVPVIPKEVEADEGWGGGHWEFRVSLSYMVGRGRFRA